MLYSLQTRTGVVDVCLIPEVKFELKVLTEYVQQVMKRKGHCVVCIAEGAGQDIVQHGHAGTDKSGNPILKDIGTHLRDTFKESMEVGGLCFASAPTLCLSLFDLGTRFWLICWLARMTCAW